MAADVSNLAGILQGLLNAHASTNSASFPAGSTLPVLTAAGIAQFVKKERAVYMLADAAASTTGDYGVMYVEAPNGIVVTAARIIANGNATASDSVYATLTLQNLTGTVTIASATTKTTGSGGTGNWAAKSPFTLTLVPGLVVAAASQLSLNLAKASTGTQLPSYLLQVQYYEF